MKFGKIIFIMIGALGITALGIDASDTISGSRLTMLASVWGAKTIVCPVGMVELSTETDLICVDKYEASVGVKCPVKEPASSADTATNIQIPGCQPESQSGQLPWRFATYRQAEQLCALASKQLLTPALWYESALGTTDNSNCNTAGDIALTGTFPNCQSGIGSMDMIGNVWEFVKSDINEQGELNGRVLPKDGYISNVNNSGIATETSLLPNLNFQSDYFWSVTDKKTDRAIMRGGFYGGRTDAGIYSTHTGIDSNFSSGAIGFRCMIIK